MKKKSFKFWISFICFSDESEEISESDGAHNDGIYDDATTDQTSQAVFIGAHSSTEDLEKDRKGGDKV